MLPEANTRSISSTAYALVVADGVAVIQALRVEHAIGQGDAPAQGGQIVMRDVVIGLRVVGAGRQQRAVDADITQRHAIAQRARPLPAHIACR
jgi:hypothetical protein